MRTGDPTPVLGHGFREIYSGPAEVSVLKCEDCGKVDVSWSPLVVRAELEDEEAGRGVVPPVLP